MTFSPKLVLCSEARQLLLCRCITTGYNSFLHTFVSHYVRLSAHPACPLWLHAPKQRQPLLQHLDGGERAFFRSGPALFWDFRTRPSESHPLWCLHACHIYTHERVKLHNLFGALMFAQVLLGEPRRSHRGSCGQQDSFSPLKRKEWILAPWDILSSLCIILQQEFFFFYDQ